ncbi:MAG TPA: FIST N-terminal domain-containing protein [Candidatus Thermoplasmatota archaeon]|nr:FIST N-terminal domain-containing protein [Candidatus Thermoplasmatota archaeon]
MMELTVETAIGMSRKWDAREAGREVAETAIQNLTRPPDFFLLFATIHYEKYGGFQEFLNGVWDVLPKKTPLVGGTVTGFMNNYGCFSRGASALAVSYPSMDVAIGVGKNTKRNPNRAAKQCADMIQNGLKESAYKNKFLLNFISGPVMPSIPGVGQKKYIRSGFVSNFALQALGLSQALVQKGLGREDEIFEETVQQLPDYQMILGTSMDDYKGMRNYQFYNDKILTNAVVNLGVATDLSLNVYTTHGMKETDLHFTITKLGAGNHAICKINDKPAVPELLRLLEWPEGFLTEETMIHTILYYPISLKRHGREVPVVMPMIMKNYIIIPCVIDDGEVSILTVSGKGLINAVKENLHYFDGMQPEFGLFSACMTILQTLGHKTNIIQEELHHYFKDKSFLLFYGAGEGTYSPSKNITYANMSFNTAIFGNSKK